MADEEKGAVAVEETKPAVPADETGSKEAGKAQGESGGDQAPPKDDAETDETKLPKQGGFQKRIAKLSTKVTAAQAEAEYWRQRALATKPEPGSGNGAEPSGADKPKPRPEDFEDKTTAEYLEALTDWKADQKLREYESRQQAKQRETAEQEQQRTSAEKFASTIQAGREAFEDFDEAIESLSNPAIPITKELVEALITSENGAALMYHLATHQEDIARIAKLPAMAAARELGKLEARIAGEKPAAEAEEEAPPKPIAKAPPPPPTPIKRAARVDDGELRDDLPPEEWRSRFLKRMEKARRP